LPETGRRSDETNLGSLLYQSMEAASEDALVLGNPSEERRTLIDGQFDLQAVARDFLSRLTFAAE